MITELTARIEDALLARNAVAETFFPREALRLAAASREMAGRFVAGGRLLAFGRGAAATDAQHVAVEFVHPVIVGKRALPALDLSAAFRAWVPVVAEPGDLVMGFAPPGGDADVAATLHAARARGAYTFALPGTGGDYAVAAASDDAFVQQEVTEILYHTLWETVHVFIEHREQGHDVGDAAFLYPFLGNGRQDSDAVLADVAASIVAKARDVARLREAVAATSAAGLAEAARVIHARVAAGGRLFFFGNGGSATDANDAALDCVMPPAGRRPLPALSLAQEPAVLTALANDVGADVLFLRQLIAHTRPGDVVVAFTTSGSSANITAALAEARRRGLLTVALLGQTGGEVVRKGLADLAFVVPSDYVPRIQEVHASLYHVLISLLEERCHGDA